MGECKMFQGRLVFGNLIGFRVDTFRWAMFMNIISYQCWKYLALCQANLILTIHTYTSNFISVCVYMLLYFSVKLYVCVDRLIGGFAFVAFCLMSASIVNRKLITWNNHLINTNVLALSFFCSPGDTYSNISNLSC